MRDAVSPSLVQAFYHAYARQDVAAVLELLSEDVEWKFPGPVEIFPFCGYRRGKAAVIEYFKRKPIRILQRRMEPDDLVIDGNRTASFSKMTAVENGTGRVLTFHCAHLATFRAGKVVSFQAIADTFGVLEQLQGVEILVAPPLVSERLCELWAI